MPEQAEQIEGQEEGQQQGQEQQEQGKTQQQIDWENDANPYKKRYGDSQGQIQPLVRTLNEFAQYDHNTKAWKLKQQAAQPQSQGQPEDIEKILEGYDPEFRKAMGLYLNKQIAPLKSKLDEYEKSQKDSVFLNEYNSGITASRSKALEQFGTEFDFSKGGKFNTESPLYKLANEILTSKYAQFNPDGTFHRYTSADAEYMATVEAYALLSKRAKQAPVDNGKLAAIQGKGNKASGVKKNLSYEEYSKLSDEGKDAYDQQQVG